MFSVLHTDPDPVTAPRVGVAVVSGPLEVVMLLEGEADTCNSPQFREDLISVLASAPRLVVLDFSKLEFCDLAGARAIHDFVRLAADHGTVVEMRDMSKLIRWLYDTLSPSPVHVETGDPLS